MTLLADKAPLNAKDIKNILPYVEDDCKVSWKQSIEDEPNLYRTRPIHRVEFTNGVLWLVTEYSDERSYEKDKG